jgi:hypothetical protein
MMGAILFFGVALAALKNPSALLSESVVTITLLVMLSALLGSLFSRGPTKGFWVGYSLFGWFILILWETTWLPTEFVSDTLFRDLNSRLFEWMHPGKGFARAGLGTDLPGSAGYLLAAKNFQNTFYAFLSHLMGFLGGAVGYSFANLGEGRSSGP